MPSLPVVAASLLPAWLLLVATPPALAQEPAYLAGDRFVYERIERDAAGLETKRIEVVWEVLESTATGHRIRILEDAAGAAKETVWTFDRDHNALAQEAGACRNASEPNAGRYRWPMSSDSAWSAIFEVVQHCPGEAPKRQGRCEVHARVVMQGTYDALQAPVPAIAIERVVTCVGASGNALDGAAVRWEKELLCPTLGVRCAYEYHWALFGPGQATPSVLGAYRDLPQAQTWGGRIDETLRGLELR